MTRMVVGRAGTRCFGWAVRVTRGAQADGRSPYRGGVRARSARARGGVDGARRAARGGAVRRGETAQDDREVSPAPQGGGYPQGPGTAEDAALAGGAVRCLVAPGTSVPSATWWRAVIARSCPSRRTAWRGCGGGVRSPTRRCDAASRRLMRAGCGREGLRGQWWVTATRAGGGSHLGYLEAQRLTPERTVAGRPPESGYRTQRLRGRRRSPSPGRTRANALPLNLGWVSCCGRAVVFAAAVFWFDGGVHRRM